MATRFVRVRPIHEQMVGLRDRLDSGEVAEYEPFEAALTRALDRARFDPETGEAVWIEGDYCSPPPAMERAEGLEDYSENSTVVVGDIDETVGWRQVEDLPELWDRTLNGTA